MHEVFNFHPKCKKICLIHLCFVDDLLIFSKGNLEPIVGIQNVLKLFYSFFELKLNCTNSELYSIGVNRDALQMIQQVTGFKIGSLPIRYLGVSLVTRRLIAQDCAPLVEKVNAKINSWATKFLSYVGGFN